MLEGNGKDREILYKKIDNCIDDIFNEALSILEVFVDDEEKFKKLRSRFLRVGNNKKRFLYRQLKNYVVKYKPIHLEKVERDVSDDAKNGDNSIG